MKVLWQILTLVLVVGMISCQGDLPGSNNGDNNNNNGNNGDDPYAPCTDPAKCCPQEKMQCYGDADTGITCTCSDLWDCSKNPNKCEQDLQTPDGASDWDCEWTEFKYICKKEGSEDSPPQGGSDWHCKWNDTEWTWECTKDIPPNPPNTPEGAAGWNCVVDTENNKLVCERKNAPPPPDTGGGQWSCDGDICTKEDDNGGLPPGGSNWKCHKTSVNGVPTWVCYGETEEGGSPPGGNGWDCKKVKTEFGKDIYVCERPEQTGDTPPGGGYYSCVKGSEFGGTVCEKVDTPPQPPGPEPQPGQLCEIDERMWCDGLVYCGWGQVECDDATGTWKTKMVNGKQMLDCQESMAQGKVPNTVCACYHYFFNPSCCERPDCIVPPGTSGQICPASQGGLCDYCNPLDSECVEPGAKCIVTNAHETFCGRDCSSDPCPSGYQCMEVKLKQGQTRQCVPADFSCYY
jgi:hypothetical protein